MSTVIVLFLTGFWLFSAYIQVHLSRAYIYNPNHTQNITRIISECGSGEFAPNSYEAFKSAANEPSFGGILADIGVTKDGVFVCVSSDRPFEDRSISVSGSNYNDIKELFLFSEKSSAKSRLCLLSDFLSVCYEHMKTAIIRFEFGLSDELVRRLLGETSPNGGSGVIFCSHTLTYAEKLYKSNSRTNFFVYASGSLSAYCLGRMGNHFAVKLSGLKESVVKRAHEKNEYVYVYGVKTAEEIERARKLNADYIFI